MADRYHDVSSCRASPIVKALGLWHSVARGPRKHYDIHHTDVSTSAIVCLLTSDMPTITIKEYAVTASVA